MTDAPSNARAVRTEARLAGTLVDLQGNRLPITVVDLSANGFRLECSDALEIGERVEIHCGRGPPMPAELRWVSQGEAGGVFLEPPSITG